MNEMQLRWLDGVIRDRPELAPEMSRRARKLRQSAERELDAISGQRETAVEALITTIERHAIRTRVNDLTEVIDLIQRSST
jgi:hypothetical protein